MNAPVPYRVDEPSNNGGYPEISMTFTVPAGTTKNDLEIELTPTTIRAGVRGEPAIVEGYYSCFLLL